MQWYENEVKALVRRLITEKPKDGVVVFYGSSSFRLWSTLKNDFPNTELVNVAFGGSTLEACAYFFECIFYKLCPKVIFFYAGDNDIGDGKTPEMILKHFKIFMRKARAKYPQTPIIFLSIKPSPSRWKLKDKIVKTNELIKNELQKHDNTHFIDIYSKMLNEKGVPESKYFDSDMLHLSPKGYEVWAKTLKEQLPQYLS